MTAEAPPSPPDLSGLLENVLPESLELTLYHIATPPVKAAPLYSSPPTLNPTPTTLESHFFALSHASVLVFALEILVYVNTKTSERTVFVSKADSSGYLPESSSSFTSAANSGQRISVLRTIATTAVKYVVDGFRSADATANITISLFARSQSQYLFPNSATNKAKHVLEDRELIAWWCKVLNPIFKEHADVSKAYLLVPGSDRPSVQKLLPAGAGWVHGHPFVINPEKNITVREVIPHFPDDPKARFLDELNGEEADTKRAKRSAKWAAVKTVHDFWELMSYRQECSLGRCVGFVWVVIEGTRRKQSASPTMETQSQSSQPADNSSDTGSGAAVPTDKLSQQPGDSPSNQPAIGEDSQAAAAESRPGSQPPATPKKKKRTFSRSGSLLSPRKKLKPLGLAGSTLQKSVVKAHVVLDDKRYHRAVDSLLNHGDFGTIEIANSSTYKWVQGISAGMNNQNCGRLVRGTVAAISGGNEVSTDAKPVNVLSVRKKPKDSEPVVNTLSGGLVRKKRKGAEPIVNTLDAGLVRKKPKDDTPGVNTLSAHSVRKRPKD